MTDRDGAGAAWDAGGAAWDAGGAAYDELEAAKVPHPQPEQPEGAQVISLAERRREMDEERDGPIVMRRRRLRRKR